MNKKMTETLKSKTEEFLMTKGIHPDEWYVSDLDASCDILKDFFKVLDPKLDLDDFIDGVQKRRDKQEEKRITKEMKKSAKSEKKRGPKYWPKFKGQAGGK